MPLLYLIYHNRLDMKKSIYYMSNSIIILKYVQLIHIICNILSIILIYDKVL